MSKFTLLDFLIFVTSILIGFLVYFYGTYIPAKNTLAFMIVPFILVAFLLSISALIVNSWEHKMTQKLIESKHYNDLLFTLKMTSYLLILTGSTAVIYGIFLQIFTQELLVVLSAIILLLFFISIGYLFKNIRRIFLILEFLSLEFTNKR